MTGSSAGAPGGVNPEAPARLDRPGPASVGGPSGPMPFAQIAATRDKSIGPEGPPTRAGPAAGLTARRSGRSPRPPRRT
ncbi:DUF6053 domain-containing protein [Lysobacter yananisis]|uniref:DUF6053 domain-containing protein n=1 Tax=Lysobacter yananisis TaxID=1003114 RepID=UPI003CE4F240